MPFFCQKKSKMIFNPQCLSPSLRDALIGLIKRLVLNKSNCRPLIDSINCLVDLITLAHLHQGRALPNTKTNVIEAGPNQRFQEDKDWYYNIEKENEKSERCGPVTFSEVRMRCATILVFASTLNGMSTCCFSIVAERIMESKSCNTKNKMLGNRNGWLAIVATIAAIEVVFNGQRNVNLQ